jgi:hypothetical protein
MTIKVKYLLQNVEKVQNRDVLKMKEAHYCESFQLLITLLIKSVIYNIQN